MMTSLVEAKTRILRKRVSQLALPDDAIEIARDIVVSNGMKLPGATEALRVEWLNDLVVASNGEFGLAARDPAAHFHGWVAERSRNRYHVSYRSVDAVSRRLGAEIAARFAMVIWPQEIAWAQRMRLSPNPQLATKSALFLREAEGHPGKVFEKIADTYSDAFMRSDYSEHPAHSFSVHDIRFSETVPDFTPLFLRYAARAYAEKLVGMPRDRLMALASVASRDEMEDRTLEASRQLSHVARSAPMRRLLQVISVASSMNISPNDLFRIDEAFIEFLGMGRIPVEATSLSPHGSFMASLDSEEQRSALLLHSRTMHFVDPAELAWEVIHFRPSWLDQLPASYRGMTSSLPKAMEAWQTAIAEEAREAPFDPISDFGFFLANDWSL